MVLVVMVMMVWSLSVMLLVVVRKGRDQRQSAKYGRQLMQIA